MPFKRHFRIGGQWPSQSLSLPCAIMRPLPHSNIDGNYVDTALALGYESTRMEDAAAHARMNLKNHSSSLVSDSPYQKSRLGGLPWARKQRKTGKLCLTQTLFLQPAFVEAPVHRRHRRPPTWTFFPFLAWVLRVLAFYWFDMYTYIILYEYVCVYTCPGTPVHNFGTLHIWEFDWTILCNHKASLQGAGKPRGSWSS